jgi:hypothetical protein
MNKPPVFPLAPRSKVPLIPARYGGKGLHDATTNSVRIKAWWTVWPDANIGGRTGVVFDVVDLDGPGAIKEITAGRANGPELVGPSVRTPRGWHIYVQPSAGGNRAGVLPGVDYRGVGGWLCRHASEHQ